MILIPSNIIWDLRIALMMKMISIWDAPSGTKKDDFDVNDFPILSGMLEELYKANFKTDFEYTLPNKFEWYFAYCIPEYVEKYMGTLRYETYLSLSRFMDELQANFFRPQKLPEWRGTN